MRSETPAASCSCWRKRLPRDAEDTVVIDKAQELVCVLVSVNGDFADIVTYPPSQYGGIIGLQVRNHPEILPQLISRLTNYVVAHPDNSHYRGKLFVCIGFGCASSGCWMAAWKPRATTRWQPLQSHVRAGPAGKWEMFACRYLDLVTDATLRRWMTPGPQAPRLRRQGKIAFLVTGKGNARPPRAPSCGKFWSKRWQRPERHDARVEPGRGHASTRVGYNLEAMSDLPPFDSAGDLPPGVHPEHWRLSTDDLALGRHPVVESQAA